MKLALKAKQCCKSYIYRSDRIAAIHNRGYFQLSITSLTREISISVDLNSFDVFIFYCIVLTSYSHTFYHVTKSTRLHFSYLSGPLFLINRTWISGIFLAIFLKMIVLDRFTTLKLHAYKISSKLSEPFPRLHYTLYKNCLFDRLDVIPS